MTPTVATVTTLVAVALAIGYLAGRWRRTTLVDAAATRALATLRTLQRDDDLTTIRALPPMVSLADVLEHASRLGIGVTEAADSLFLLRAKALLDDDVRRHRKDNP